MSSSPTPSLSKLRAKLKSTAEYKSNEVNHIKFNPSAFIKAAKELQKTLQPEEVLLDATNSIAKSN